MMGLIIPGSNVSSGGGADCCCFRQHPSGVVTLGDKRSLPRKANVPTDGGGTGRRKIRGARKIKVK